MKIIITNKEKLNEAIREAEGKATARTIDAERIEGILNEIGEGIAKAKLHGTKVYYDGAEHFANSYKYRPMSTHFQAENIKGKWYVTNIFRDTCPRRVNNTLICYSEEAKSVIISNASNCCM